MEDNKLDLVLAELKNICNKIEKNSEEVEERFDKIDERFERIDKKFEQIDKKFEQIDKKFEQIDERFDQIDSRLDKMDKRFEQIDSRLDSIQTSNLYEHGKIYNMLSCLNSAFLRFETEQKEKIDFLFESDKERKEHQSIYAYEFTRLNDLVAKNTFSISNLEQHLPQN